MKKFGLVVDIVFSLFLVVIMCYNFVLGINNHDSYYLILGLMDCYILKFTIKNIEEDIDNINNMW